MSMLDETAICPHCQVTHAVVDGRIESHRVSHRVSSNLMDLVMTRKCPGSGLAVEREDDPFYGSSDKEIIAVLKSQIENHDVMLEQVRMNEQCKTKAKLARADVLAVAAKASHAALAAYKNLYDKAGHGMPMKFDACMSWIENDRIVNKLMDTTTAALQSALTAYETGGEA